MDIFLTPQLKSYYIAELDKAKKINDKSWDIDKGIVDILDDINLNPKLQTILSKKSENLHKDNVSYLHLAHTKDSFEVLNNTLNNIVNQLMAKNNECGFYLVYFNSNEYRHEGFPEMRGKHILDAIGKTEIYTNINAFIFEMYSFKQKHHNMFWDTLKKELRKI